MRFHRSLFVAALAALVAAAAPAAADAQSAAVRRPAVSLSAGAFQFDLSGTGTAPMVAARYEHPLTRYVLFEGGLAVARPEQQFGQKTTFLAPEAQFQLQLPLAGDRVAPYIGAGAGAAFDLRDDEFGGTQSELTISGAGGLRAWLNDQVGLRGELRVRGIGSGFEGSAAEWTAGVAVRF